MFKYLKNDEFTALRARTRIGSPDPHQIEGSSSRIGQVAVTAVVSTSIPAGWSVASTGKEGMKSLKIEKRMVAARSAVRAATGRGRMHPISTEMLTRRGAVQRVLSVVVQVAHQSGRRIDVVVHI